MPDVNGSSPTRLLLQPRPPTTRYNRVVQYGACVVAGLVLVVYVIVVTSHHPAPQWERPAQFVSLSRPLIAPAQRPLPPPPPPVQQLADPLPQPTLPPPRQGSTTNPDAERRKQALLKALVAKVLVEDFSLDGQHTTHAAHEPPPVLAQDEPRPQQTLTVPAVWPNPPDDRLASLGPGPWALSPWGHSLSPVGRSRQFWQQSSGATTSQWLGATVQPPLSPYQLTAGTIIPAVLAQAINSDLEGPVSALVTQNVYDTTTGRYLLIPQGARLEGYYDNELEGNQTRLNTTWKTLYFPNGVSLALNGMPSTDGTGRIGLSDQVNRHFWQRYGTALVLSAITAGISLATYSGGGFFTADPRTAATYGLGNVLGRTIGEDLQRSMQTRPTLTIRPGLPFDLRVTQDLTFPGPYPFPATVQDGTHPGLSTEREEGRP